MTEFCAPQGWCYDTSTLPPRNHNVVLHRGDASRIIRQSHCPTGHTSPCHPPPASTTIGIATPCAWRPRRTTDARQQPNPTNRTITVTYVLFWVLVSSRNQKKNTICESCMRPNPRYTTTITSPPDIHLNGRHARRCVVAHPRPGRSRRRHLLCVGLPSLASPLPCKARRMFLPTGSHGGGRRRPAHGSPSPKGRCLSNSPPPFLPERTCTGSTSTFRTPISPCLRPSPKEEKGTAAERPAGALGFSCDR